MSQSIFLVKKKSYETAITQNHGQDSKKKSDLYCQSIINKAVFSTELEVLSLMKDQVRAVSSFCEVKIRFGGPCTPVFAALQDFVIVRHSSLQLVRLNLLAWTRCCRPSAGNIVSALYHKL